MNTTQAIEDINKELCQLLGIEWHEVETKPCSYGYLYRCSCGVLAPFINPTDHNNPDFTSDPVALLREMRKRGWRIGNMKVMFPFWTYDGEEKYTIDIDYLLDDTGKLAIEARDFLRNP